MTLRPQLLLFYSTSAFFFLISSASESVMAWTPSNSQTFFQRFQRSLEFCSSVLRNISTKTRTPEDGYSTLVSELGALSQMKKSTTSLSSPSWVRAGTDTVMSAGISEALSSRVERLKTDLNEPTNQIVDVHELRGNQNIQSYLESVEQERNRLQNLVKADVKDRSSRYDLATKLLGVLTAVVGNLAIPVFAAIVWIDLSKISSSVAEPIAVINTFASLGAGALVAFYPKSVSFMGSSKIFTQYVDAIKTNLKEGDVQTWSYLGLSKNVELRYSASQWTGLKKLMAPGINADKALLSQNRMVETTARETGRSAAHILSGGLISPPTKLERAKLHIDLWFRFDKSTREPVLTIVIRQELPTSDLSQTRNDVALVKDPFNWLSRFSSFQIKRPHGKKYGEVYKLNKNTRLVLTEDQSGNPIWLKFTRNLAKPEADNHFVIDSVSSGDTKNLFKFLVSKNGFVMNLTDSTHKQLLENASHGITIEEFDPLGYATSQRVKFVEVSL
jgi:hypothetical protein